MTRIAAVEPVLAPHTYPQDEITAAFQAMVVPDPEHAGKRAVLQRVHRSAQVRHRHLALPLEDYARLTDFGLANDAFIRVGLELGELAVKGALARAGVAPDEVDVVMTTSVTGIAAPSLDARLVARLGLREDVKRVPMFGLGCVAGAAGVARLHDLLRGDPDGVAVLLSVELCSLTFQRDDASTANLVASGLFGDGAAAAVMVGERRARAMGLDGPAVVDTRARLYPGTERVMGWDVGATGFRIVLDASVADVVEAHLGDDVRGFLAAHDLGVADVGTWVCHPGGPKVLDAVARTLGLPDGALARTWESLAAVGNLSSSSVLHVLADVMAEPPRAPGELGLMLAMGPGFGAELVLLRW